MGKVKILDFIIKAHDKASKPLKKGEKGVLGLKGALKGMINPATLAAGAVTGIGLAAYKAFSDFQSYTREVADFAAMIGSTTEEASVFIQMSDDFNITMDTMLASFRSMAKSGLAPTIEGMEELRLQYLAIKDPAEALFWIQGKIGEQGIKQILPMWEQIDGSLIDYAESMDKGLIITDEMKEKMEKIEIVLRDVKAAWKGFTLSIGYDFVTLVENFLFAVSATTLLEKAFKEGIITQDEYNFALNRVAGGMRHLGVSLTGLEERLLAVNKAIETTKGEFVRGTISVGKFKEAIIETGDTGTEVMREFTRSFIKESLVRQIWSEAFADGVITDFERIDMAARLRMAGVSDEIIQNVNEAATFANLDLDSIQNKINALTGNKDVFINVHYRELDDPKAGSRRIPRVTDTQAAAQAQADLIRKRLEEERHGRPYQFGGTFNVGGFGGIDSELVKFRATPGEKVTVGGDNEALLAKMDQMRLGIDKLGRIIPIAIRDAIERIQ